MKFQSNIQSSVNFINKWDSLCIANSLVTAAAAALDITQCMNKSGTSHSNSELIHLTNYIKLLKSTLTKHISNQIVH